MVLGIFVKSEKIWDILKIENLEYANANLSERVQVLEGYHGKLNCCNQIWILKVIAFSIKQASDFFNFFLL